MMLVTITTNDHPKSHILPSRTVSRCHMLNMHQFLFSYIVFTRQMGTTEVSDQCSQYHMPNCIFLFRVWQLALHYFEIWMIIEVGLLKPMQLVETQYTFHIFTFPGSVN